MSIWANGDTIGYLNIQLATDNCNRIAVNPGSQRLCYGLNRVVSERTSPTKMRALESARDVPNAYDG